MGEIVLIGDDNEKCLFWTMARIIELIPGRDGKIRTVKHKTQHGTVLRPVQRVYPLEIRANENCVTEEAAGEGESNSKKGINVTIAPNDVIKKNILQLVGV
ncbi:integrase catalytic domain-containing protein [Trichonephila clavipes]|nr:integrase catalytic domain-containing protein [Trichonephila clavipes]